MRLAALAVAALAALVTVTSAEPDRLRGRRATACAEDESLVRVEVTTDNYPDETSWQLLDACNNQVVLEVKGGDYVASATTYDDKEICVPADGPHTFTIHDRYSDGICCFYGEGGYKLLKDGETLKEGGDFGASEETRFGSGGCPPTPAPVSPCAEGQNHLHLDLLTHQFPTTIEWRLTDKCTGEVVEQKGQGWDYGTFPGVDHGKYREESHLYQEDYCVSPSTYEFKIETGAAGGLCCFGHGDGHYTLSNNGGEVAAGSDLGATTDHEGASETTAFVAGVSCDPTKSPTGVPTATLAPSLSLPPTRPPVDCGDQTYLHLELTTHAREMLIRWELFDECSGKVVMWRGGGGDEFRRWFEGQDVPDYRMWYTEAYHTYHEDICVPHSMYQFKIKEKELNFALNPQNGHSDLEWEELIIGRAHYKLSQDGAVVAQGNSLGGAWRDAIESTSFGTDTCPQPPTGSPTKSPTQAPFKHSTFCPGAETGESSHFTLAFRVGRSMKARWKLYDDHTGQVLARRGWSFFDFYYDTLRPYHHDFCFPPSQYRRYKFIIEGDDFLGYENGSEYGVYSLKENGIPVATGMRTGVAPAPAPTGGMFDFPVTKREETVFGEYDEAWEPPAPLSSSSDADLSNGQCPPCHLFALVGGCISCDLFRGQQIWNGTTMVESSASESCSVPICEDRPFYVPEGGDISFGVCEPCQAATFLWSGTSVHTYTGLENYGYGTSVGNLVPVSKSTIECIDCAAWRANDYGDPHPSCLVAACDAGVAADEAAAEAALCEAPYVDAGNLFVDEGSDSVGGSHYMSSIGGCLELCDSHADCYSVSFNPNTYGAKACYLKTKCGSPGEPVMEKMQGDWDLVGWHTYYKPMSCCEAMTDIDRA